MKFKLFLSICVLALLSINNLALAATTTLTSGTPKNGFVSQGLWQYYKIANNSGELNISVELSNLSADVDLYVKVGSQPSTSNYDCRPYKGGTSTEKCNLSLNTSSYIYIGVHGYKSGFYTVKASLLNLRFPANEVDWVATIGSDAHEPNLGYKGMNDLFAIDLGRSGNADRNMPVYPVAPGQVVVSDNDWGFVMIKHTTPLALGDGTVLNEWYSGYMHMSGIFQYNINVDTNTIIGNISNVEDSTKYDVPDHLHFAIYTGDYRYLSQMKSIDIANNIYGLTGPIIRWDEWCSNTSNPTHYFSNHWWSLNTAPCSYYR